MITGLIIYLLAMFGATLSTGLGMLRVLRVLQGMSAGAATIVSRVVIRDMFAGSEAQRLMAQVMMIFSVAPAIAPILGGWLDRKSTRLNSSHVAISYAVFCLKKKNQYMTY